MRDIDDKELLQRIATGDREAMRALYERHADGVLAFIRSRGADPTLADDVLHDAMLDVWRSAGRFAGKASVRTWIFSIARNRYVDRVRRGSKVSYVDAVPETADDAPDAEAVMSASEDVARVRHCLSRLKEVQRIVIRLAFFDGLSYDEIAEVEGVPVGTVKSRVFHAKQVLLRCLGSRDGARAASPA